MRKHCVLLLLITWICTIGSTDATGVTGLEKQITDNYTATMII
jgi:hypothetical protein